MRILKTIYVNYGGRKTKKCNTLQDNSYLGLMGNISGEMSIMQHNYCTVYSKEYLFYMHLCKESQGLSIRLRIPIGFA